MTDSNHRARLHVPNTATAGRGITTRILITGSREWTDIAKVRAVLAYHRQAFTVAVLVHGNARGADRIAARIWKGWGLPTESHPVSSQQWERSRGAGHARNRHMISLGADLCLAFILNQSSGATQCACDARRAGIPTYTHAPADRTRGVPQVQSVARPGKETL
jgi:hypothetical protein